MAFTQKHREVSVHCALADDVLLFQELHATEQLGRMFELRVTMASTNPDIKLADVIGKSMTVKVKLPAGGNRFFNGIVTRLANQGWHSGFALYEATVHPALWLLTRSSNCRIFQNKTTLEIIKQVFQGPAYNGAIELDSSALAGTSAKRVYCVQYRESDYDFVCRLLEEEGIYFFFQHAEHTHTMVLADSMGAHSRTKGYETLKYRADEGLEIADEAVTMWSSSGQIEPSTVTLNDFDFEKMTSANSALLVKSTAKNRFAPGAYEQYDYPGRFDTAAEGGTRGRAQMEAHTAQSEQKTATSIARGVTTGGLFKLAEHPSTDQNREFLVTAAITTVVGIDYRTGASTQVFTTNFTAVGTEHNYRAPAIVARPIVRGPQTAIVVGKQGEEIWVDKYGRIKVQFHWDRLGNSDETSSCWVRVAQGWAGKGWGAMFIPRIGMEVVVEFLEGDPDRPLVTGCVYNGTASPPYDLPAEQTKSTIRSNSSKGGAGFNEIRFEDKKDSEEIFIQAEKDFNRVVKNNDTLKVGFEKKDKGDQTIEIKNDQSLDVGNDRKIHVKNDQTATIDGNQKLTVTKDRTVKIDGDEAVKIAGDQKIDVGKTCVIEATSSIELKVGGSSIKIEPAKITIKSVQIDVDASAMMKIKAGGIMTIEGALVKIN